LAIASEAKAQPDEEEKFLIDFVYETACRLRLDFWQSTLNFNVSPNA
jgi:hypothetical protein